MARPCPEDERERDLIEAGLNEPLRRWHSDRRQRFQRRWSSTIARLERAHNLDVMARMLLYGKSRFLSACDFKRLRVVKRSRATTSTLEACQRPSSQSGQRSPT